MTTEWAKSYLVHPHPWLTSPCSHQFILLLDNLLTSCTTPSACASSTASLIEAQQDITLALSNLIGLFFSAANSDTTLDALILLVSYLVELAKLPDAINASPEAKIWDAGGGEIHEIPHGAPIVVEGKKLWSELPMFSWNVTERFQGPELWTRDHSNPATSEVATEKWRDVNALLALIARNPEAQSIPSLAGYVGLARVTLSEALEHSSPRRLGKNTALHMPGAAVWFSIAGEEVERMCKTGTERMAPGDLWVERGGSAVVDERRLAFWRERLTELQQG